MNPGQLKDKLQDVSTGSSIASNLDAVFAKVAQLKADLDTKQKEIADMITVLDAISFEASNSLA